MWQWLKIYYDTIEFDICLGKLEWEREIKKNDFLSKSDLSYSYDAIEFNVCLTFFFLVMQGFCHLK